MSNQPPVLGRNGVARPYIGGQALIEGVMMRSPQSFAAVVRRKSGELVVREQPMPDTRKGFKGFPLVRGVVTLVEALKLGSRALRFSAEVFEQDLLLEEGAARSSGPSTLAALSLPLIALFTSEPDETFVAPEAPKSDAKRKLFTALTIVFAIALFVALPQAFAAGVSRLFHWNLDVRSPSFQLVTGVGKLAIIVGYMLAIRRLPEIYRVFQYHGAEHKSIYVYEAGEELTVDNARAKTTLHPRCGTTFLVMVALVSVAVFTALGPFLPQMGLGKLGDNVVFFFMKLPFLPLIAAVTFEVQRVFARYCTRGPLRALLWPGFLVQKITTIEPDDEQLEVALGALAVAAGRERNRQPAPAALPDRSFESFASLTETARAAASA
jgi:uncharacterized protein YqhQ